MTKESIIKKYNEIWEKYSKEVFSPLLERGFVFQYDEDETDSELLFVGINPAYSEMDTPWRGSYVRSTKEDVNIRAYFKPFVSICNELHKEYGWKGQWTHIDVFTFRETNQKRIENELLKDDNGIQFLYEQLMVAFERILHIKPKAIVVSNALARMFTGKERGGENDDEYGVWMGFRFKFDKELGTDVIIEPLELLGTPVFFTSMLSGQRALDKGSRERLVWHINEVLKR